MIDLEGLPAAGLVEQGLADLAAGAETIPALAVSSAATRLRRLGLPVPVRVVSDAELRLYRALLAEDRATAYSRYNALRRRLVSLIHALEREEGAKIRDARSRT